MKLIKPSYKIINQEKGLEGIYKAIELAGRVSHKSEGNIKEGSAKTFVDNMIKLGHGAALEFGTVYMKMLGTFLDPTDEEIYMGNYFVNRYIKNPYSKVVIKHDENWKSNVYVTTNYRVLVEHNWLDDLKYICEPTEYHEKRYCVKFICDRGVSHEFVRHRCMSFLQESTRYCNYSSGRFNHELTYIIPSWMNIPEGKYEIKTNEDFIWDLYCNNNKVTLIGKDSVFVHSLMEIENYYFLLLDNGWKPQQARQVLPNALKTELVVCGFASDWEHFFKLRDDKLHAHPDAYALAHPLHEEFKERGYIDEK